jgi:hypothetical protein
VQRRIRIRNITCHKRRCRPRVPVQFALLSLERKREISEGPHPRSSPRSGRYNSTLSFARLAAQLAVSVTLSPLSAYRYVRANRLAHVREAVDSQLGTRKLPLNRPRQVARSERQRPFSKRRDSEGIPLLGGGDYTRWLHEFARARLPASLLRA